MVVAVLVPDGAADPLGAGPTCLERARTPTLDRLAAAGRLCRVRTIPAGLAPGTEVGLPTLLGARLSAPVPRGAVEAAAAGVAIPPGCAAWRADLVPARAASTAVVAAVDAAVRPLGAAVVGLGAHRMLLVGPAGWGDAPCGPHQTTAPLSALAAGVWRRVVTAMTAGLAGAGQPGQVWPWGAAGAGPGAAVDPAAAAADPADADPGALTPALGADPGALTPALGGDPAAATQVVADGGAAAGIARLLGCRLVAGPPAHGAEVVAAAPDGGVVVVHDARPDTAAHARAADAKIAALERFDREVVGPVARALDRRPGALLVVIPDHGCDPATGAHTAAPVPALVWQPGARRATRRDSRGGARVGHHGPGDRGRPVRWTERAVATRPVLAGASFVAGQRSRRGRAA